MITLKLSDLLIIGGIVAVFYLVGVPIIAFVL
jgi:hypothetical protein